MDTPQNSTPTAPNDAAADIECAILDALLAGDFDAAENGAETHIQANEDGLRLCKVLIISGNHVKLKQMMANWQNAPETPFGNAARAFAQRQFAESRRLLDAAAPAADHLTLWAHAEIHCAATDYINAYRLFARAIPPGKAAASLQARQLSCLELIAEAEFADDLYRDIGIYIDHPDTDPAHVLPLALNLITQRHKLSPDNLAIDLNVAWHDKTLITCIGNLQFNNVLMENTIAILRRQVLKQCLEDGYITQELTGLICALCHSAYTNEYIMGFAPMEEDTLAGITELLADELMLESPDMLNITSFTLLLAMYTHIYHHPLASQLLSLDIVYWPVETQATIRRILYDAIDDNSGDPDIQTNYPWSQRIAKENELNGFERWQHLARNRAAAVKPDQTVSTFNTAAFLNSIDNPKILIAGAASGHHALEIAALYPTSQVTAIDLSPKRLSYARKMAIQFGIDNIRFEQVDLIDCGRLQQQFHLIDLRSVLNVIENPNDGLGAAKQSLASCGIIKANFYSALGREKICQFRVANQKIELEPSMDGLRELRTAILQNTLENLGELAEWDEFYRTSAALKLLFNPYEYTFIPDNLQSFCQTFGFQIRAFEFGPEGDRVLANYRKLFPSDQAMNSLANWKVFEEQFPETFHRGYRLVLQ